MDQHSTILIDNCQEILLEDYSWSNFSFVDTIKHKIHLFLVWLFCTLFGSHDWIILITPWTVSDISTVEEFRKYQAKSLKCSCCGVVEHCDDANLTKAEMFLYQHRTYKYFTYNK